jgi:hypothetical protein
MRSAGSVCGALVLAASLIVTNAVAATTASSSPLAPGKPAGVKQAQAHGALLWWIAGLGVVGLGAALVASGNGNNSSAPATSTTTSP